MALTFIRHAQSVSNAGGITMPHRDIPLTERGWTQARELAEGWTGSSAMVWASKFLRTQQTAEPFCQRFERAARIHPALHEFSMIDEALIAGLDGPQRKPFVKTYWDDPNPQRRHGSGAETFAEFDARVRGFRESMHQLPDESVLFGHGIWIALLFWQLQGHRVQDRAGMSAFRDYQLALPMLNCAVFNVRSVGDDRWRAELGHG